MRTAQWIILATILYMSTAASLDPDHPCAIGDGIDPAVTCRRDDSADTFTYSTTDTDRRNISTAHFSKFAPPKGAARKARATFVMLVRESELYGAIDTVRQLEDRFNRHIQYPYVFLNDRPFSDRFKEVMKRSSKADMVFAQVPTEHWSYPSWISQDKAAKARTAMKNVIYGSSESYRHMCRYQSGLLVQHDALLPFDFYWRIEPNVKYSCDIEFDPFLYMQDNNKKYAFVISLYEYPETIHGLWNATREFMTKHPGLLAKDNAIEFISNDGGQTYNLCHFWSNFEIVDARWMRGEAFQQYFSHLDQVGGFYYERWGDAPVHTIAASLLLSVSEIHFFREIGYYHEPFHNCPAEPDLQAKCHCDPGLNVSTSHVRPSCDRERHTCTPKFLEMAKERSMVYPEELDDYQV